MLGPFSYLALSKHYKIGIHQSGFFQGSATLQSIVNAFFFYSSSFHFFHNTVSFESDKVSWHKHHLWSPFD